MPTVRIKFCGMTRPEDVECALRLGVEEIGLVFAGEKRRIGVDTAAGLARLAHGSAVVTGLFMDPPAALVYEVLAKVPLDRLQFHGRESAAFCARFGKPWIKAIAAAGEPDLTAAMQRWTGVDCGGPLALLLDAHCKGKPGGGGKTFDWSRIPERRPLPIYLAGGLTPDNVASAIRRVRPETVDVSSGIESAPGVKCPRRMQEFVDEVRDVNAGWKTG